MIPLHIWEALMHLNKTKWAIVVKVQHLQARTLLLEDFKSLAIFCCIVHLFMPDDDGESQEGIGFYAGKAKLDCRSVGHARPKLPRARRGR